MIMEDNHLKKIAEIKAGMQCSKGFVCENSGFEQLCKAVDLGIESFLDCRDENRVGCPFVIAFGNGFLCECPLRLYIGKNLKR